jgi:hypothetical protein
VPPIRLHDLRHTHATLLLSAGEPVSTVSERPPGDGKRAASRFAALIGEVAADAK